jgi:hypothetical protein
MRSARSIPASQQAFPIVFALAAALSAPALGQSSPDGALYLKVKDVAGQIKIPPRLELKMGTFNAATGKFLGERGMTTVSNEVTTAQGKSHTTYTYPRIKRQAIKYSRTRPPRPRSRPHRMPRACKSTSTRPTS